MIRAVRLLAALAALAVAACSSTVLPASAGAVVFGVTSSASLRLHDPRFDLDDGHLDLRGIGYRFPGRPVPRGTHVDVRFLDAEGRTLREQRVAVYLPSGRAAGGPATAKYRLHVGALPPGTARVEIRADETAECGKGGTHEGGRAADGKACRAGVAADQLGTC